MSDLNFTNRNDEKGNMKNKQGKKDPYKEGTSNKAEVKRDEKDDKKLFSSSSYADHSWEIIQKRKQKN